MAASRTPNSCPLQELPAELLKRCMPGCKHFQQYLAACKWMLNSAVADYGSGSLRLRLLIKKAVDEPARRAALVRIVGALPAFHKLKVYLGQHIQAEALGRLLAPPDMQGPDWLANVTDVVISQGMNATASFDNFIPGCLGQACPRLLRLTLQSVKIIMQGQGQGQGRGQGKGKGKGKDQGKDRPQGQQQQQWQPTSLPCLRDLVLDQCDIHMSSARVQEQLQAMPNLTKLALTTDDYDTPVSFRKQVSKLTVLGGDNVVGDWAYRFRSSEDIAFPALKQFAADGARLIDGDVEFLARHAPNLQQLDVESFAVEQDHQSVSPWRVSIAPWDEDHSSLQLTWEGLLDLGKLVQRISLQWLYLRGDEVTVDLQDRADEVNSDTLQAVQQAVWAVQQAGGLRFEVSSAAKATFIICKQATPLVQNLLHATVGVFQKLHSLSLQGPIRVDTSLLEVVGGLPNCKELEFEDLWDDEGTYCEFVGKDLWEGRLISSLPHVDVLTLRSVSALAEDVFMLCYTAPRAIKLFVLDCIWEETEGFKPICRRIAKDKLVDLKILDSYLGSGSDSGSDSGSGSDSDSD